MPIASCCGLGGRRYRSQAKSISELYAEYGEDPGSEACACTIEDEQSKFSLNVIEPEILEEIDSLGFKAVSEIQRRIQDEGEGAAQPFVAVEELLMLKDVSEKDFIAGKDRPGLRDLFTVYGSGKVNLNTAPRYVLECIPDLEEDVIEGVIEYRSGRDGELGTADDLTFEDFQEISDELQVSADDLMPLKTYCTCYSECFKITGYATRRQGRVKAACSAVFLIPRNGQTAVVIEWKENVIGS